jgi:hypothetical protein
MQDEGIARDTIAISMLAAVLGGLALQVPIGRLSDRFDRCIVLAALGLGFAGTAAALVFLPQLLPVVLRAASAAWRVYVDPLPGLRCPRARPDAGRPSGSREQPAHPREWAWLGDWSTHRDEPHSVL